MWLSAMAPILEVHLADERGEQGHPFSPAISRFKLGIYFPRKYDFPWSLARLAISVSQDIYLITRHPSLVHYTIFVTPCLYYKYITSLSSPDLWAGGPSRACENKTGSWLENIYIGTCYIKDQLRELSDKFLAAQPLGYEHMPDSTEFAAPVLMFVDLTTYFPLHLWYAFSGKSARHGSHDQVFRPYWVLSSLFDAISINSRS